MLLAIHPLITTERNRFATEDQNRFVRCFDEVIREFKTMLEELKVLIADYRDKQIEHEKNPRILRPTAFDDDGAVSILTTFLYPKPSDSSAQSVPVKTLREKLGKYLDMVAELVRDNRDRSFLRLEEKPITGGG